jgi:hypothetical protein
MQVHKTRQEAIDAVERCRASVAAIIKANCAVENVQVDFDEGEAWFGAYYPNEQGYTGSEWIALTAEQAAGVE